MNKRGQFYLLAAIVLVAIIIGLAGVMNYSKVKSDTKLIDLGEELGIEGGKVLEYGVYNPKQDKTKKFTEDYSEYAGEGKNLFFIFGTDEGLTVATYADILSGEISLGGTTLPVEGKAYQSWDYPITGDEVFIEIEGASYEFELKPGENFYFVVSQELASGEEHVVQG